MKYQKSMMKMMETLLKNKNEEVTIERLIKDSSTGRSSSFDAIRWLDEKGFIEIKSSGNQKRIKLKLDNSALQFKYYLDSLDFKSLEPLVKLVVSIFIHNISDKKSIKFAVLFGSVLKKGKYNDIDLILLGDKLDLNSLKSLKNTQEKIERFFGILLNLHIGKINADNLFKGLVVHQPSYIEFEDSLKNQYNEFVDWSYEAIKNKKDKSLFEVSLNNAITNLAYVYCNLFSFSPKTKKDAINQFDKMHKVRNLSDLKKRGIKIGKQIFK
ncbi:MAG: hypothetical protein KJ905_02520 [Nanoarchaeota archaeon]|nr:hypothetical protein [Nanoarchaeota archaeon]MBU1501625.1 hypothetical protein [Nanoarchaeota archaeon]